MPNDIIDMLEFHHSRDYYIVKKYHWLITKNNSDYAARLSNGPMESLNRIPKDLKRNARGY